VEKWRWDELHAATDRRTIAYNECDFTEGSL